MTWDFTVHISDILAALSLGTVIGGSVFAYKRWERENLLKRASYIGELTEKIRTDKDISRAILFWITIYYGIQRISMEVAKRN